MSLNEPRSSMTGQSLTYNQILNMLHLAEQDTVRRYAHLPRLCNELQTQIRESVQECNKGHRSPLELVMSRLRTERLVFDAYNRHRLGDANNLLVAGKSLGDDIDEDLEAFPFRCEVVLHGFEELTLNLQPIRSGIGSTVCLTGTPQSHPIQFFETPLSSTARCPVRARCNQNKLADTLQVSSKQIARRQVKSYDKLQDAPAANMSFPRGNITLAELAAFHPKAISSWDVIERYCNNGGSASAFKTMINYFREMSSGPITSNTVLMMMKKAMERRAKAEPKYQNWTASNHSHLEKSKGFDPTSISMTGFRRPAIGKNRSEVPGIPIKDMANGVKRFPAGEDALDLTRAVQYCQANPNEHWLFPDHFESLVYMLGPTQVTLEHQDAAVLARHTTNQTAAGVRNAASRTRDWHGRLQKVQADAKHNDDLGVMDSDNGNDSNYNVELVQRSKSGKRQHDSLFEALGKEDPESPLRLTIQKRRKLNPGCKSSHKKIRVTLLSQSRLRRPFVSSDESFDSVSDDESYDDPNEAKTDTAFVEPRRSTRVAKLGKSLG